MYKYKRSCLIALNKLAKSVKIFVPGWGGFEKKEKGEI